MSKRTSERDRERARVREGEGERQLLGKVCRVGMPASTSASKRRDFDVATITFNASRRCSHCFCLPFAVAAVALALAGVAVVVVVFVLIVALFFTSCCSSERTARRRNSKQQHNNNKICQLRNSPRTAQAHNTRTHTHTNTYRCMHMYLRIHIRIRCCMAAIRDERVPIILSNYRCTKSPPTRD